MAGHELLQIEEGKRISPKAAEFVAMSRTGCERLMAMVNSLLDVSKLEAGKMELHRTSCDLGLLADEAAKLLATLARERNLEVSVLEGPVLAFVDRDLIFRALQNLISNALKFTPRGGSVKVVVESRSQAATVSIADTGSGIPPEYHQRIFEKFGQVKQDGLQTGTGLGLTFCRLAVTAHGGDIGVESEVGKGSRFWFRVPHTAE
jgi:signal transduction histidine kinase